jgi:hypothetical protein
MARGKGGGDDWGTFFLILGIGLGGLGLYYLTAGREEKNAALIPDRLEDQIDLVVKELNEKFGPGWVNFGLNALEGYMKSILPWQVVGLVNVIYQVEQLPGMRGPAKRWEAADRFRRAIP